MGSLGGDPQSPGQPAEVGPAQTLNHRAFFRAQMPGFPLWSKTELVQGPGASPARGRPPSDPVAESPMSRKHRCKHLPTAHEGSQKEAPDLCTEHPPTQGSAQCYPVGSRMVTMAFSNTGLIACVNAGQHTGLCAAFPLRGGGRPQDLSPPAAQRRKGRGRTTGRGT